MTRPPAPTTLSDGTITLRSWRPADRAALVDALNDDEILYWFDYLPQPVTDEAADQLLASAAERWVGGGPYVFAACDPDTDMPIGCCSVSLEGDVADVSYWTHRDARGRGVAPRALRLVADWLYAEIGCNRLQLLIDQRNEASRKVAERAGFIHEGVLLTGRTNNRDFSSVYHAVYGMTREEFTSNKLAWTERAWALAEALVLAFTASPVGHMGHGAMTPTVHHTLMHLRSLRTSGVGLGFTAVSEHLRTAKETTTTSLTSISQSLRGVLRPPSLRVVRPT